MGLGTTQINGGINHVFTSDLNITTTIILTITISIIAGISAWKEVNKEIRLFSKSNILTTLLLLFFIFFNGDIQSTIVNFSQSLYFYIIDFIPLSLSLGTHNPGIAFLSDWTF